MAILNNGIELLFPTPIYYITIGGSKLQNIQNEMEKVYSRLKWECPESWQKSQKLSNDSGELFEENYIEKYKMIFFEEFLNEQLENYCNYLNFNFDKNCVIKTWFSKFENGDFGHIHNHLPADISGCYYFKTQGDDGKIYFEDAKPYKFLSEIGRWEHEPVEGKMLLFPSWLKHGVHRNLTNNTRVSFAFNIFFNNKRFENGNR